MRFETVKKFLKYLCSAIIVLVCFLPLIFLLLIIIWPGPFILVDFPKLEPCSNSHPANRVQSPFRMDLMSYEGELYLFKEEGLFDQYTLCKFSDGRVKNVFRPKECYRFLGLVNEYLYYSVDGEEVFVETIRCYNLKTNKDIALCTEKLNSAFASIGYSEDGSIFIPVFQSDSTDPAQYIQIKGDKVIATDSPGMGFQLGERNYSIRAIEYYHEVVCSDGRYPDEPLVRYGGNWPRIIPFEKGLLIHNSEGGTILKWIDINGNETILFSVPCMDAVSAANIHGSDVYFSFMRFEEYGSIGMRRYENDTLEGTYRLSLKDFTFEKINDWIFNGLYNFDDTGFYCTDDKYNIYKMDFDGNVTLIYGPAIKVIPALLD